MTSLPSTESHPVLPVQTTVPSAGERQHVSETTHDEVGDDNIDDELNYKVDVCGTSMLDSILQAANSLSTRDDVAADDNDDDAVLQQQQQQQQQQQLGEDNNNYSENYELAAPSTVGLKPLDIINNINVEVIIHSMFLLVVIYYYYC